MNTRTSDLVAIMITTGPANAFRDLVGRPELKRSLRRPTHRWKDNIKMDLKDVGSDARYWIDLAKIETNSGLM